MQLQVFLVGTDHRYQRGVALGVPDSVFAEFRAELHRLVSQHAVCGIAEEMSLDGLGMHRGTGGSLGYFLAAALGLPHLYCDPPRAERRKHGIATLDQRERYWLAQLQSFSGFPCLFILGSDHVSSFSTLLRHSHFTVTILVPDWEPEPHLMA